MFEKIDLAEQEIFRWVQSGSLPKEVFRENFVPSITGATNGMNTVFFEMDAMLSSLVRAGDRLVKLVNAIRPLQEVGVKSKSLHAFVDTIKNHSQKEMLDQQILDYWKNYGERIKDYRDMIEHNEHIKDDFTLLIRVSTSDKSVPSLILPDNPKDKSLKKIEYNKGINAYEFLNDAYKQTVKCIEDVLSPLRQLAIEKVMSIKINSQPK